MKGVCDFNVIRVDDRKSYLTFGNCPIRLVFEDNEYVGWYYAGESEETP